MSALAAGLRSAAVRLVAAPGAVFLAVLTAGLAASSTARHTGLYSVIAASRTQPGIVLACPRTRPVNAARSSASAHAAPCPKSTAQTAAVASAKKSQSVEAANESPRTEKHADAKAVGGASASIPLPDFNVPELSRFTSPL